MRSGMRGSVKFAVPMRDRGRARQEELERVGDGLDAALADDRNRHGARNLVDREHGDRADRRTGEAAGDVAEPRTPGLDVDRHAAHRVDDRQRVGARGLALRERRRRYR